MLTYVVALFPNATSLPSGINTAFSTWSGYLHQASAMFPVSDLLITVGVVVVVELAIWAVVSVLFVFKKIRGA